jgi:hypothetical protein
MAGSAGEIPAVPLRLPAPVGHRRPSRCSISSRMVPSIGRFWRRNTSVESMHRSARSKPESLVVDPPVPIWIN